MNPLQIREKISEKHTAAQAIVALAEEERRALTDQDQTQFDALLAEIGEDKGEQSTGLYKNLYRSERLEALQLAMAKPANKPEAVEAAAKPEEEYNIRSLGFHNTGPLKAYKSEESAYKAGMWLKAVFLKDAKAQQWCQDRGVGFRGAQTGDVASGGGYTVPDPVADGVIEARNAIGVARRVCDVWPASSDSLSIPRLTAGQTVQYPDQADAITESDTTWGNVACTIKRRAVLTLISNQLMADSVVNMADKVASRAGYELGLREDTEFISGTGAAGFGGVSGLKNGPSAGGTVDAAGTTYAAVTLAELNTVAGTLPDKYHSGASWIMSRAMFAKGVQRLLFAQGGTTLAETTDGTGAQLFGYPIWFTDNFTEAVSEFALFFGNFAMGSVLADRQGIEIASSQDYAFNQDSLAIRVTSRYDLVNFDQGSGADPGSYIGLKLAAS